jgi:hypothetical protein
MIRKMLWRLGAIGPIPKFKIGDSVQVPGNDHLMVIQKIDFNVKARSIVYTCKWFHQGLKSSQINLYEEHQLKLYDWHSFFLMGNEKWHGDMVADHES